MNSWFVPAGMSFLAKRLILTLSFVFSFAAIAGQANATWDVTFVPSSLAPPVQIGAASRKVHGGAGTFDLPLTLTPLDPSIEPRGGSGSGIHTVVITFDKPVTGADVAVIEGTANAATASFVSNEVIVGLTGVSNAQYVTVSLTNVSASDGGTNGGGSVRVGFLAGDVNGSRSVTLSDLLSVNGALAQTVTAENYLLDVNLSGTLSLADKMFVNSNLAQALAPPPSVGAPTCTITPTQTVFTSTSVTLALGNCTAPAGGALTYSWNEGSVAGTKVAATASYTTPVLTATTQYWATVTGSDDQSTSYSTTVIVTTVTPPPATGKCSNYTAVNLGDLNFDGTQVNSVNMHGSAVAYGRIVIPNPLPAGWAGKTAQVAVFEHDDGSIWKKVYLSKVACDFTPVTWAWGQGNGVALYMNFGGTGFGTLTVQPGDIWYLNVKNESIFGTSSCGLDRSCNFAVRMSPPSE